MSAKGERSSSHKARPRNGWAWTKPQAVVPLRVGHDGPESTATGQVPEVPISWRLLCVRLLG